jgi:tryptophan-rich hypothetical protein
MNTLNPKKLLNSKWTAVTPTKKEKHFLVTKLNLDEQGDVVNCLIEAIISRRSESVGWRELKNDNKWLQGWI